MGVFLVPEAEGAMEAGGVAEAILTW